VNRALALALVFTVTAAGCGGGGPASPDSPLVPVDNPSRGIADTRLRFDLMAHTASASITFEPSTAQGATLEVGDLTILGVAQSGTRVVHGVNDGKLTLALAASDEPRVVDVQFDWKHHEGFMGASTDGYTFVWPYFCGNLFPCHSNPADGSTFTLALDNVPVGKTAVFPATIPSEAPSYQLAWAIDEYTELALGATTAGTSLSVWYRPGELAAAQQGTAYLRAAFDWLEKTIGPYKFGRKAGGVSVNWRGAASGGMEHHPYWHVAASAVGDVENHIHEAAHGWFGNGVRIACWEDFVLSEGTTTYLTGRALEVVAPEVGSAIWQNYAQNLGAIDPAEAVWPDSCNAIDILKDGMFTRAPYLRGAFFYRGVALRVGAAKLEEALAAFYAANALAPARMSSMLKTIATVTGYDPTQCATAWLRSTTIPSIGPCH